MRKYKHKRIDGGWREIHIIEYEKKYGKIPVGYVVHHINGDRTDNSIENLTLMTRSEHSILHCSKQKRNKKGQYV